MNPYRKPAPPPQRPPPKLVWKSCSGGCAQAAIGGCLGPCIKNLPAVEHTLSPEEKP